MGDLGGGVSSEKWDEVQRTVVDLKIQTGRSGSLEPLGTGSIDVVDLNR